MDLTRYCRQDVCAYGRIDAPKLVNALWGRKGQGKVRRNGFKDRHCAVHVSEFVSDEAADRASRGKLALNRLMMNHLVFHFGN